MIVGAASAAELAATRGSSIRSPFLGGARAASAGMAVGASAARAAVAHVPDIPWLAEQGDGVWMYGHGDRTAPRRLPDSETGLAIDESWIASSLPGSEGRSVVRIRDGRSGRSVRDVAAPIWVSAGAWTAAGLVVTGYGDASMANDGGLLLIRPVDGSVMTLVEGGPFARSLGSPIARGEVLASPTGQHVASNVCGVERCELAVVEIATGRVSHPVHEAIGFLRAITDQAVVVTDGDYRWISARAIADGAELWRLEDRAIIDPLAVDDGAIVGLIGSNRAGWAVSSVDSAGRTRALTARVRGDQAWPRVWRHLSNSSTVVVGRVSFEEALAARAHLPVTLLGLANDDSTQANLDLPASLEPVP